MVRIGYARTTKRDRGKIEYLASEALNVKVYASGVDVRTVAGRLGRSGGGTTTLKVYSAWVAEADQKAASRLTGLAAPARGESPAFRVEHWTFAACQFLS